MTPPPPARCDQGTRSGLAHRLVPEVRAWLSRVLGCAQVDAWQRFRFFEGLARAYLALDRPLLLVVDNLQSCDKATMSWLSFLVSYAGSAPLLVAAPAREDELDCNDLSGRCRRCEVPASPRSDE